ncbi:MAG TPA: hypothetical protein PLN52_16790, partial [Opitutaceae bacterium]|nr:hypothetical protein [Opitutaceae bacterium]
MTVPPLTDDDRRAYAVEVATSGGAEARFSRLATACLARFLGYGGGDKRGESEITAWTKAVYAKVSTVGWPQPLGLGQMAEAAERVIPNLESWVKDVLGESGTTFVDEAEKR